MLRRSTHSAATLPVTSLIAAAAVGLLWVVYATLHAQIGQSFLQRGQWKFDEGAGPIAFDSSVFGNHGQVNNALWVPGISAGTALNFSGSDDSYVEVANKPELTPTTRLLLDVWVKPDAYFAPYNAVIYKGDLTQTGCHGERSYALWITSGGAIHFTSTSESEACQRTYDTSGNLVRLGEWSHIVVDLDTTAGRVQIFHNGIAVLTGNYPQVPIKVGNSPLRIGGMVRTQLDQAHFAGTIDEVVIAGADEAGLTTLHIDARANLWGAGGQGAANVGGGIDPPGVIFTAAPGQVLTFSSVTGATQVGCGGPSWGPDGDLAGSDGFVPARGQISGVNYDRGCSLPLFGVFLGPSLPAVPPPSLDFTQIGYSFSDLSPEPGQLFFIGDGLTGTGSGATQRFHVPAGATRLYLGVLDGPGFWGDNSGALDATFNITPAFSIIDTFTLRLFNVDDVMSAYITNSEFNDLLILSATLGGDTSNVDISAHVRPGRNVIRLELVNTLLGWVYGYDFKVNGVSQDRGQCGIPFTLGCEDGDTTLGVVWTHDIVFDVVPQQAPPPTVSSLSPAVGPVSGGTLVIVTGTNFVVGATVTFGTDTGSSHFVNSTTLEAITPQHNTAGTVDVTVTNPDGHSSVPFRGFTYFVPCTYDVAPLAATFEEDGGLRRITVTTTPDCHWTAASNDTHWLTIDKVEVSSNGTGNGTVEYRVKETTDASARDGSLTIADQIVAIHQDGLPAVDCSADYDVGNVSVMFVPDSSLIRSSTTGLYDLKLHRVARQFYCRHPDIFQFVTLFSLFRQNGEDAQPKQPAFHRHVRTNNVEGLGTIPGGYVDFSIHYGSSSGTLEGIVNMKSLAQYPTVPRENIDGFGNSETSTLDILGHEFAHRWAAYVRFKDGAGQESDLLLEDPQKRPDNTPRHWSFFFNSDASVLWGNDWLYRPRRPSPFNTFLARAVTGGYSALDLYLMGLLAAEQVPELFYITDSPNESPDEGPDKRSRSSMPDKGFGTRGTRVSVTIGDIIQSVGARKPDVSLSKKAFRQSFVLIVPSGQRPTPNAINESVRRLERLRQDWHTWFRSATRGLGRINSNLR